MCGIAGFLGGGAGRDLGRVARAMADALRHRGPDDAGTWADAGAGVALGHRRLAVIDLSPAGRQPMASASGRHVLVLNGEIYNFRRLRAALGPRGHRFRGHSDTEVLLAAVEEWGVEEALRRAEGMFALALWDRSARTPHPGARPGRQEAALPRPLRRHPAVRLRAAGAAGAPRLRRRDRPRRARPVRARRLGVGRAHDPPRRAPPAAGVPAAAPGRRRGGPAAALLVGARGGGGGRRPAVRRHLRGGGGPAGRAPARGRGGPARGRRAAGRPAVGRHRLEHGGGAHAGRQRGPGADLLDRLPRARGRRGRVRARGGAAPRDGPPRALRQPARRARRRSTSCRRSTTSRSATARPCRP